MWISYIIVLSSYFSTYPQESREAITFLAGQVEEQLAHILTQEETIIAMSIVAPEVSQYSSFKDKCETGILKVMYIQKGWGNFSIGPFQMQPKFAETLEAENRELFDNCKKTEREKRYDRIKRLSHLDGQIEYLLLFIQAVRQKTANISFRTNEEKLLHWATLYNGGVHLSNEKVKTYLAIKQFPKCGVQFNYAQICLEFYKYFRQIQCCYIHKPSDAASSFNTGTN